MADVTLTAQRRSAAGKGPAGRVRREGLVPAVVYGLGSDAQGRAEAIAGQISQAAGKLKIPLES